MASCRPTKRHTVSGVTVGRCGTSDGERPILLELEALNLPILLADGVKDLASEGGRHAGLDPGRGDEARVGLDDVERFRRSVKGEEGDGLAVATDEEFQCRGHGSVRVWY